MSLDELQKALTKEKITFGANETLKNMKRGKVKVVMLAKNCSDKIREDVVHYASLSDVKVVALDQPSDEISLICKKNFPVTVLSY